MDCRVEEIAASQERIESSLASISSSQASTAEAVWRILQELAGLSAGLGEAAQQSDGRRHPSKTSGGTTPSDAEHLLLRQQSKMSSEAFWGVYSEGAKGRNSTWSSNRGSQVLPHVSLHSASNWNAAKKALNAMAGDMIEDRTSCLDDGLGQTIAPTLPPGWPTVLQQHEVLTQWAPTRGTDAGDIIEQSLALNRMTLVNSRPSEVVEERPKKSVCLETLQEPDSVMHQAFDLFTFILIAYDLLVIPYAMAWEVNHNGFTETMDWVLVSFWSLDIALSFVTGFYDDGELVVAIGETSRRYLRTWFLPDLVMVVCDWFVVVVSTFSGGEGHSAADSMFFRFAKLSKILRIVDVLRFLRIVRTLEGFVERRLSNSFRLALRMASISAAILWVNHVIACIWFAVGRAASSDTGSRWLQKDIADDHLSLRYEETSAVYQYATAYHWAVTQCTLSSMELVPSNSAERVLVCFCMMFGLVFGSGLVSVLSATLVDLRMLARDRSQKISVLRQYLLENHVDKKVALFIQRQVTERLRDRGRLTGRDVPALMILSSSARKELHSEIILPHLIRHPLFRLWDCIDHTWCSRFCSEAADMTFLRPHDDLFLAGSVASEAYYLISGRLTYTQEPESSPVSGATSRVVEQGAWLCESCLWSEWIHVGKAEAGSHCQVLVVQADGLLKALQSHRVIRTIAADYANAFHQRIVAARPPISEWPDDLEVPFTDYGDIVVSLRREVQVTIGMVALDTWKPKGGGALFSMPPTHWDEKSLKDMRQEVADGKSLVVLDGDGEMERVVSLVVMRITREDGCVLVQLGKWEDDQVFPDCQLPALKRERNELSDDAVQRLMATKLAPLRRHTKVLHVAREISVGASKGYGVRSKYLRKVYSAIIDSDFEAQVCPMVSSEHTDRLTWEHSFPKNMRTASVTGLLERFMNVPVYFFSYRKKGVFCAWLPDEDFERLKRAPNVDFIVKEWLRGIRSPIMLSETDGTEDPTSDMVAYETSMFLAGGASDSDSGELLATI